MPHTKNALGYRTAAKQLTLLAAFLCALLGGMWLVETKRPLDATDLKIEASQLRSLSAEANELAGDLLSGAVTQDFFDVHTQMLFDKTADARERLASTRSQSGLEAY